MFDESTIKWESVGAMLGDLEEPLFPLDIIKVSSRGIGSIRCVRERHSDRVGTEDEPGRVVIQVDLTRFT